VARRGEERRGEERGEERIRDMDKRCHHYL
jgi:hypothetical protein